MRKLIIVALMAATAIPVTSYAQSAGEVRRSQRDVREAERDLQQARRHGDRDDVRRERRDVRDARQELREDWRDHRQANRGAYSRGSWKAPFRYRTFNAGMTLNRSYYAPRYHIGNPGHYRLPATGRNQRWVRHYDDVILVNVRNGRIIRVIRNFYW